MTWEELKEKALEIFNRRYNYFYGDLIGIELEDCEMFFREDGTIDIEFSIGKKNVGGMYIAFNRTYDQMYQIMLALR